MKQQRKQHLKLICFLLLSLSLYSHAQVTTNCGSDFHGTGEIDKECPGDITVTSTPSEGSEGTVVYGLIFSKFGKVKFQPGHSKVRFVPYTVEEYVDDDGVRVGRKSRGGTGGKPTTGGRYSDTNLSNTKTLDSQLKTYPNPISKQLTVTYTKSSLSRYEIYSLDGRLLISEKSKQSSEAIIDLQQLKSGPHLIKFYFENGEIINKHIIKQ